MNTIWVKSSLSFSNGNCVEVASLPGGAIGVRNSRDPRGPVLRFTPEEWGIFVCRVRLGHSTGPEGVRLTARSVEKFLDNEDPPGLRRRAEFGCG